MLSALLSATMFSVASAKWWKDIPVQERIGVDPPYPYPATHKDGTGAPLPPLFPASTLAASLPRARA